MSAPRTPDRPRTPRNFLRIALIGLCALVLQSLGCANGSLLGAAAPSSASETVNLTAQSSSTGDVELLQVSPSGPGTVFETPEAAAVDALAYSYLATRRVIAQQRRARGGAIVQVEGGYSYAEPDVARDASASTLRYRLAPTDVAHFRHDPRPNNPHGGLTSRSLDRKTRRFVDRRDPMQRPFFFMTPERFVGLYTGADVGVQTLARVQRATDRDAVALHVEVYEALASLSDGAELPLALVPQER